jgi:hypothetical protein
LVFLKFEGKIWMPREEIGRRECKRIIDRRNQGRQEGKE